jgi:uncharacterized protein (TIGR02466 family)
MDRSGISDSDAPDAGKDAAIPPRQDQASARQDLPAAEETPDLAFEAKRFEVRSLFPTPLLFAPVHEAAALNAMLERTILGHAAQNPGVDRSNAGGWQSEDDFAAWSGAAGVQLLELGRRLADTATGVMREGELARGGPDWKINAWANINRAGDVNLLHHHPAAFWSGVYWVSTGEGDMGGEFEMMDPRGVLPAFYAPQLRYALPGCLSAGGTDYLTPEAGVMVLFPAWLQHAVRPHTSAKPRISVAFNLCV